MNRSRLPGARPGARAMLAAATACATLAAAAPAAAYGYGSRHYGERPGYGYVVAESQWGHGTIRGAVRPGRHGLQVRMPRGSWIDCVRSCSDTLRRQTIDFWESNGPQAPGSGRGYLNWEFRF